METLRTTVTSQPGPYDLATLWGRGEDGDADDAPAIGDALRALATTDDLGLLVLAGRAAPHHGADVALWDARTGCWRATLLSGADYRGETCAAAFARDRSLVVIAPVDSATHGSVTALEPGDGRRRWSVALSGDGTRSEPDAEIVGVALADRARLVAAVSRRAARAVVLAFDTGRLAGEVPVAAASGAIACDADARWLALGTTDGRVIIADPRSGTVACELPAELGEIVGLAFAPDGRSLLAVGAAPGTCLLRLDGARWIGVRRLLLDNVAPTALPRLPAVWGSHGPYAALWGEHFVSEGGHRLSGAIVVHGIDGRVRCSFLRAPTTGDAPTVVAFSPDGHTVLIGSPSEVLACRLRTEDEGNEDGDAGSDDEGEDDDDDEEDDDE